jgi:hypothetical protein
MPYQRSMSQKKRKIKDAMPKKHEPKKYMMMNEKIAYFQKFQSKRERGMTL